MKSAVLTFGRFQPPTVAHYQLVDLVVENAPCYNGADDFIFISPTHDTTKNPLDLATRVNFMWKYFRGYIVGDPQIKSPFDALMFLGRLGYEALYLFAGADRMTKFKDFQKYVQHPDLKLRIPGVKKLELLSSGHRDPDSEGIEGVSATRARLAAKEGNFKLFCEMMDRSIPTSDLLRIYSSTRRGLGLNDQRKSPYSTNI